MYPVEPFESAGPSGPAAIATEVARGEGGSGRIAVLLAVAAIVAAAIGWQTAVISDAAGDEWQTALRTEVKRAASAQEDVRFLYENELPVAVRVLQARELEKAYRAAAESAQGTTRIALEVEADAQAQVAAVLEKTYGLTSNPAYGLPSGGLDLALRLADLRAESPDILALDPAASEAAGDALANKAELLTLTLLPTSVGALFGVLAQPLRRHRYRLLAIGWAGVIAGAGLALAVWTEVLA